MAIEQDVAQAVSMTEDELLESLGVAALGAEGIDDAVSSRTALFSVAAEGNKESAESFLSSSLLSKGRALFAKLWDKVKGIICYIHNEGLKIEDEADLVKYLAAAVVAAGAISNALAVLVVTIAVKQGLAVLCLAPSKAGA